MAPTNLYIDEVYIDTDSDSAYTGIQNLLHGSSVDNSISTTVGYKWIVQITNASSESINMATTPVKLNICTNYKNDENGISENDYDINIYNGTIAIGASYYIGHDLFSGTIPINIPNLTYLPDQSNGTGIIAASRIRLYLDDSAIDVVGNNAENDPTDGYLNTSVVFKVFDDTTNSDGSIRRRAAVVSPAASYLAGDWQVTGTNYLSGSAAGDPHIATLNGDHYEFDYLGAFRLFENSVDDNLIIINGLSEFGPGRWKKRQYIRKLFIQNNDKYMLIDMGFRGSPIKILENNGIEYNEKQLSFNKEARRYSFDSTYSTLDLDEEVTDILPALIRNQIVFTINITNDKVVHIMLQNVNEYNLQPCRLAISNINKYLIQEAKGCLVDKKYAPVSKLDNIQSLERLEEPSLEDFKNTPELEINPKLQNIQWQ